MNDDSKENYLMGLILDGSTKVGTYDVHSSFPERGMLSNVEINYRYIDVATNMTKKKLKVMQAVTSSPDKEHDAFVRIKEVQNNFGNYYLILDNTFYSEPMVKSGTACLMGIYKESLHAN